MTHTMTHAFCVGVDLEKQPPEKVSASADEDVIFRVHIVGADANEGMFVTSGFCFRF